MTDLTREAKGREIAESNGVTVLPDCAGYAVGAYRVDYDGSQCNCPDHTYRDVRCKHMCAVDYAEGVGLCDTADDDGYDDLPF
ncbi:MAG: hypothetical protein GY906_04925 [bacterium]|nr:hypothetical protein [bacterium]